MVFRILKAIFSCVFLSGFGPISDGGETDRPDRPVRWKDKMQIKDGGC